MDYLKEKQEAIDAGYRALASLREARSHISSAKGFGVWDLLGGGTFVSVFKHLKIDKARRALDNARYDLQAFSRELRDIRMDLNINIGDFLTVFDIMDNFFADIVVQSRLSDAGRKIDDAIRSVEDCLNRLR